jgi:hypothetical protein
MRIVISSGHGKYVRGASGYLDEVNEARQVVNQVADLLRAAGVDTLAFHDDISTTQNENLERIVDYHNAQTRDLDVSVHFNAYETTSKPMGTECLYVTQDALADDVSAAIARVGHLPDRGGKYRSDLYFLNNTEEPAILIETCFVDSSSDAQLYLTNFHAICTAIAETIRGTEGGQRPPRPERPPPELPTEENRVAIVGRARGDVSVFINDTLVSGDPANVDQVRLRIAVQGDVVLTLNGEEFHNQPQPPEPQPPWPPGALEPRHQHAIMEIANSSAIAGYEWDDRGVAPTGYTQGIALAFAQTLLKLKAGHPAAVEMAKANTDDDDTDALAWYASDFAALGMDNEHSGAHTLRHLYVLLMGLGMRESGGQHCEGRDLSADNVSSDTAEAGLYQTSYNAHVCHPEFDALMAEYSDPDYGATCYLDAFAVDVSCSESDWECYGSDEGYAFQKLCKECPAFAVESCALVLRNLRQHYGPINRKEAELRADADMMFQAVADYVEQISGPAA